MWYKFNQTLLLVVEVNYFRFLSCVEGCQLDGF